MSEGKEKENRSQWSGNVLPVFIIALLAFNLLYLLSINNSINERQEQLEIRIAEFSSQLIELQADTPINKNTDSTIDFLRDEYTNYKDLANSDRDSFMNLVNLFFVALGVLVTGGILVIYWIFGQTKNEVKENAELTIKSSVSRIKEEADNKIKTSVKEIEQTTKEKFNSLVDPTIDGFEGKIAELQRFVDHQHSLRNSKVLVVCPQDKLVEIEDIELKRIRSIVGETKISDTKSIEDFAAKVMQDEIDIIIIWYTSKDTEGDITIQDYIGKLKGLNLEIPVVVYAKARVGEEDLNTLNSYPFSVLANMPTSLTSNMMSLANVLSFERRD